MKKLWGKVQTCYLWALVGVLLVVLIIAEAVRPDGVDDED